MNEIEELEKYIKGLTSVDKFATNHGLDKVWANRSQLLFFTEQIKQSLTQDAEDQREITDKVVAYDQLDHKFKLVCGKGVEQTLQHLCVVGFGDGSKVNHEPVEVPEFVDYLIKQCKSESSDLTLYGFIKLNSDIGFKNNQSKEGKFVIWLTKKGNEEILARAWFGEPYTVAKEPLYEVRLPYGQWDEDAAEVKTEVAILAYDITSDETKFVSIGSKLLSNNYKTKLTEERIKLIDERYWAFAVPVEEEAE